MVDIKINNIVDPPVDDQEQPKVVVIPFENRIPSNWQIHPTDDGITAYNNASREHFSGTIEEFNLRLRG
jgi:hypothetical protein